MPAAMPVALPCVTAAAAGLAARWLAETAHSIDHPALAVDALALGALCRLLNDSAAGAADEMETSIARNFPNPSWASASLLPGLIAATAALRPASRLAASAAQYLSLLDELDPDSLTGANGILVRFALRSVRGGAPVTVTKAAALDAQLFGASA